MSLYDVLGVKKESSSDEIKKAYRNLSKVHHPDVGGDVEQFRRINKAYEILTDQEKRSRYDSGESVDEIEKMQMSIDTQAQNNLRAIFEHVVSHSSPEKIHLFKMVMSEVSRARTEMLNTKSRIQKEIHKLKEVASRITVDLQNEFFKSTISSKINSLNQQEESIDYQLKIVDKMEHLIKDCEYRTDPQQQQDNVSGYTITISF